jgi:hypothetical protein
MKFRTLIYTVIVLILAMSCNNGPKVITATTNEETTNTDSGIFSGENTNSQFTNSNNSTLADQIHKVVVNEILPTTKYSYLNVTEDGEQYWIAARKQDIVVGGTYYYRKGLLKTNYESKEYNKVFEKIFLVSNLVAEDHRTNSGALKEDVTNYDKSYDKESSPINTETYSQKGSIKIAEIVANPSAYNGKTVQITGKCVKINPNIMERNWIHLQDGSKDDFDLVVTSDTFVGEGEVVTIQALVSLNKDFGAGYNYNLILENGIIVK